MSLPYINLGKETDDKIVASLIKHKKAIICKNLTIEVKDRKPKRAYDMNKKKHYTLSKRQGFKFTASNTLKRKVLKRKKLDI